MKNIKAGWRAWGLVLMFSLLAGCASQGQLDRVDSELPLVQPLGVDSQRQLLLARLNELLYRRELTDEQRAQLHYERGVLYDTLGLERLALEDFRYALELKPNYAEAYNFLGIYQLQVGNFEGAYESLDSVLELSPQHPYVQLNLGIALYYGQRPNLAVQRLSAYYQQQQNDPYRLLWLYIAEHEVNPEQAKQQLRARYANLTDSPWAGQIAAVILGDLSEKQFFEQVRSQSSDGIELAERLCESYFYLGKWHQSQGDAEQAVRYFKLSLATNVQEFIEHRFSGLELQRMAQASLAEAGRLT